MTIQIKTLATIGFLLCLLACASGPPDTDRLFQKNFLPYPNVVLTLDQDSTSNNPRREFFIAYRDKNFKKSLNIANKMTNLDREDPIQLYKAICLMSLGDFEKPIPYLKNLASRPGEFQDAARWYWSLVLLKNKDIEACKNQLVTLRNTSTYIRNEAKVLISKLK